MYHVRFYAHSGLSGLPREYETREEARAYAARRLRNLRRSGHRCYTLARGEEWESQEPEDCALVPDTAGLLCLTRSVFRCRECDSAWDTRDDALVCCGLDE